MWMKIDTYELRWDGCEGVYLDPKARYIMDLLAIYITLIQKIRIRWWLLYTFANYMLQVAMTKI
jgi:hypothetical protein